MKTIDYQKFINRYKQFENCTQELLFKEQKLNLDTLLKGYANLKPELEKIRKYEANNFNIFQVMGIKYYEVSVHSPILSDLLNPKGLHAQGDLFYHEFIKTVFPDVDLFLEYDVDRLSVDNEISTQFGRLDILIRSYKTNQAYAIVIENKIHARDQPEQLNRYYEYLQSLTHVKPSNVRLLYLTLFGNDPCEFSIHSKLYEQLKELGIIKCISYHDDILRWLSVCINNVEAPSVKHILSQYINTLKSITHATI